MLEITSVQLNERKKSEIGSNSSEYEEKIMGKIFNFPFGIFGFEKNCFYQIRSFSNGPMNVFETFPNPNTQFYIVNPYLVRSDYILNLNEDDYSRLKCPSEKSIAVFSIITTHNSKDTTCNLLGPIVLNTDENIGCQCINQEEDKWCIRHSVFTGKPVFDHLNYSSQNTTSIENS